MMERKPIDHAMVLAAGLGKRMRPLTETRPKPLVGVCGRPLIDHVLDRLEASGVRRVVVNVHYLADQLEAHLARRTHPAIIVSDERDRLLDSGGGVRKALPHLGDAAFFVCNSDSFWIDADQPNLRLLGEVWRPEQMDILMLLAEPKASIGYDGAGDYFFQEGGRLQRRRAGGGPGLIYAGALILSPRLFRGTPSEPFSLNRLFDEAEKAGRLFGQVLRGTWLHIGTPDAVTAAEAWLKSAHRGREIASL